MITSVHIAKCLITTIVFLNLHCINEPINGYPNMVEGIVTDIETGQPIHGVHVQTHSLSSSSNNICRLNRTTVHSTNSNSDGYYSFQLGTGDEMSIISYKKEGYWAEFIQFRLEEYRNVKHSITIDIALKPVKEEEDTNDVIIGPPTNFALTDVYPAWSPDGCMIAYVHRSRIPGESGIYLIDIDGKKRRKIFSGTLIYGLTWSPDGKWIAFSHEAQIYKLRLSDGKVEKLTYEGRNFHPAWSPDGEWIAYDSDFNDPNGAYVIWKMQTDGSGKRNISQQGVGEWRMPNWSPDGRYIVHQRFIGVGAPEIFIMDTSGTNPDRLTNDDRYNSFPRFSPDGQRIGFTSYGDDWPQIWVIEFDGSNPRQLTDTQGYTCDWSPDGQWIVYTDSRGGNGRLWMMRKDGSERWQFTFE